MKILRFDTGDAPADATEFYYTLIRSAKDTGFEIPDYMLGETAQRPIPKNQLFDAFVFTIAEVYYRGGPLYMLTKTGTRCDLTDQEPSNDEKKKAQRLKRRWARKKKRAW